MQRRMIPIYELFSAKTESYTYQSATPSYFQPVSYTFTQPLPGTINFIFDKLMLYSSGILFLLDAFLIIANGMTLIYIITNSGFLLMLVAFYFILSILCKVFVSFIGTCDWLLGESIRKIGYCSAGINVAIDTIGMLFLIGKFALGTSIMLILMIALEAVIGVTLFCKRSKKSYYKPITNHRYYS